MKHERLTSEDVRERVTKRMEVIDGLTSEQRTVVHDYGWGLVKLFRDCGVTSAKHQRMLINRVLYELNTAYHEMASSGRKAPPIPPREPVS